MCSFLITYIWNNKSQVYCNQRILEKVPKQILWGKQDVCPKIATYILLLNSLIVSCFSPGNGSFFICSHIPWCFQQDMILYEECDTSPGRMEQLSTKHCSPGSGFTECHIKVSNFSQAGIAYQHPKGLPSPSRNIHQAHIRRQWAVKTTPRVL